MVWLPIHEITTHYYWALIQDAQLQKETVFPHSGIWFYACFLLWQWENNEKFI